MNSNIKKITVTSVLALALLASSVGFAQATTFSLLTGQLDYGQTSANVSNLQAFLASSSSIYPQGKVTGYFGPLTKSAVMNFQNAYGIAQAGRVGPETLAKINSLISSGTALTGGTISGNSTTAPSIYAVAVNPSSTGATVTWLTDQATKAQVYYSATPFQIAESLGQYDEPVITGGATTSETTTLQTSQNVSVINLQPHTMYYYMIEATDANGNLSYTWPTTFTTSY